MAYDDEKVSVLELVNELLLTAVYFPKEANNCYLKSKQISRLALCLMDSFARYEPVNPLMVGFTEIEFLRKSGIETQVKLVEVIRQSPPPLVILSEGVPLNDKCVDLFKDLSIPIVKTNEETLCFLCEYFEYMNFRLAKSQTIHGVLMDVYGMGVLITGKSGIGKSECAVELIRRGHKFVADDAVQIRFVKKGEIVGMPPKNISNFLEIRGVGVINVKSMFGVYRIVPLKKIDMEIRLQEWDSFSNKDRLFLSPNDTEIFGVKIPRVNVPVNVGRSIPVIIETAVMNMISRSFGYDATASLLSCLKN